MALKQPTEEEVLDKMLSVLSEHFDCVQIVVSKLAPDGSTNSMHRGTGNWYARKALCEEFIELDQADTLAKAIKRKTKE